MAESLPCFHVAGVLVHAASHRAHEVASRIADQPGAQVHAVEGGRIVVTLESGRSSRILDQLTRVQAMEGVLSAVLVSEHSEPLPAADMEFDN